MTDDRYAQYGLPRTLLTELPAENRELSPYTGYTRAHWSAIAEHLLGSALAFRSASGSRLWLPGPASWNGPAVDGLEGFARTFLLAAIRNAGMPDPAVDPILECYLEGIAAGTRDVGGDDPESWPVVLDRHQPHVEAASIALGLHLTRARSWDTLDPSTQDRLAAWLRQAIEREPFGNNWYLFPATIGSFLEAVGRGDHQTRWVIERALQLIEAWYRGDGWYSDGAGNAYDHYIGWALHFYPVLHAKLRRDDVLLERLRARLTEFLATFARTFDRNGAPIHLGRSLTYRMATVTSIAVGEYVGATPLRPGQSRQIMSANLRYFLDRGSLTDDGLLSLGWHGPHAPTVQAYSGPGSPYWASKGFLALALPAEHPVWTDVEAPPPGDDADHVEAVAPAGLLIHRTAADGLVRVHNHGSDHLRPQDADAGAPDPLYARFSYSTRTGPTVVDNISDNDLQIQQRGHWSVRRRIHRTTSGTNWVSSWHVPTFPLIGRDGALGGQEGPMLPSSRIESMTVCEGVWEVRLHRLVGVPAGCRVRLSGWAIAARHPSDLGERLGALTAAVTSTDPERLSATLTGHSGWSRAAVETAPAGTAFGRWARVPALYGEAATGLIYAATGSLSGTASEPPPPPTVVATGAETTIAWTTDQRQVIDFDAIFADIPLHES